MTISCVIITKNEEKMIKECLESISWADEIIVIDSQSTDHTAHIAQKQGARVFSIKFRDFATSRNYALEIVKSDWIMYIDADERVSPELATEIKDKIEHINYSIYSIKRKNYYLGHPWPHIEEIKRLFRVDALKGWYGQLHESPESSGACGVLDNYLLHYTHTDISSMVEKTNKWSEIEAKLRFNSNHPPLSWWRFLRVMLTTYWDYYVSQRGFQAGTVGLIESIYQSFSTFITYAKLWEMQQKDKK